MITATRLSLVCSPLAIFALCLALSPGSAADDSKKPILTDAASNELVQEGTKNINDALKAPKEKHAGDVVRSNALMIALAAQNSMAQAGGNVKQMATLRDAALQLIDAIEDGKVNTARAQKPAAVLAQYPNVAADPAAKANGLSLKEKFEFEDVMTVFKKKKEGGQNIEAELITLDTKKKPFTAKEMEQLRQYAYKSALIAELAQDYAADRAKNKKKEWTNYTEDMRKSSLDLAEAVKAKNAKGAKKALSALNSSCSGCHSTFRDN